MRAFSQFVINPKPISISESGAAVRLERSITAVIRAGKAITGNMKQAGDPHPPVDTRAMGQAIIEKIGSL